MTRTKKFHTRIASLALAAVSAFTFVACVDSGDKPGSIAPVAQTGDCADIQDLLDKAIGDAAEAKDVADESRGTPDGPSDANKAEAAEALVVELIEQKEECESASTTTSTTSTTTSVATPNSGPTTTSTTTPSTSPSVVPEGDLVATLGGPVPEAAKCKTGKEFDEGSLPNADKLFSDGVHIPFPEGMTPEEWFALYMELSCRNPTLVENTVDLFCEGQVVIGVFDVCKENSWMTDYTTALDELGPTAAFLEKVGTKWFVTDKFQQYAEAANAVFSYYEVLGVKEWESIFRLHLAGPVGDELPRVVENPRQEDLPALILVYTLKDVCPRDNGASVLGLNALTKDGEVFETKCLPPPEPPCTENCGGGTTTTTAPPTTAPPTTQPGKADVAVTTPPPPVTPPAPPTVGNCPDGGLWNGTECRWLGDDSGAGAPEPEYPSWGPTPTSEPPGSVPPTTAPLASGNTVAGP